MAEYDLDDLSDAYDHRPISTAGIARARLSSQGVRGVVLDVGGGRGEHARAMEGPRRIPIVIDIAESMAERARKSGSTAIVAPSQNLPFRSGTASLVYFHLSIHYGPWRRALDEALRVVGTRGRIDVWTFDRQGLESSSLAQWFPKVVEIDAQRFPEPAAIASHLEAAGASVALSTHIESSARTAAEWESAVRARFVSTLQMLSATEIDEGLARFRTAYPTDDDLYEYDIHFVRISSRL
ncbi:MAG: class I SAM-dependent methyltransferase [Acidimicrobiia bacterium]